MKKQRGLRRYYQKLASQNDFEMMSHLDFDGSDTWFNLWHHHFDWKGYGNHSFKSRKPHLDKLFRHFDLLAEKTKALKSDFQLFAFLHDQDSFNDSLYLHTQNRNEDNFPVQIPNLSHESQLKNTDLQHYLDNLVGYHVLYGKSEEGFCVVFKDGVGRDL